MEAKDVGLLCSIILGVGGIISAVIALRRAKLEGDEQCHEHLKQAREEAEISAGQLHHIRMHHPEWFEEGRSTVWVAFAVTLFVIAAVLLSWSINWPSHDVPGPIGPQGPPGLTGPQGKTGPAGPSGQSTTTHITSGGGSGSQGSTGATGNNGATGASGQSGPAGAVGRTGAAGPAGAQGGTGAQGEAGAIGETGAVGPAGPQGSVGPAGPRGARGLSGPQGPPGPSVSCPSGFSIQDILIKEKSQTITLHVCART